MKGNNVVVGIVNLNITIDRVHLVKKLDKGKVNRPYRTVEDAGGKGVNAARVLKELGCRCEILCFLGGFTGDYIRQRLDYEKIPFRHIRVRGESRTWLLRKTAGCWPRSPTATGTPCPSG